MAAVSLEQLLDPKRAEREEGWHNFAQSYERSLNTLTDAIEKLSGKRKLAEGESAFTVLERYVEEQRNKAELDREKAARLHDMVSASIPEVTAEQKAAYEAQKKLYDQYQGELKKQTKAVEDNAKAQTKAAEASAKAQIAAIDREEKKRIAAIDSQAAQLKRKQGGDLTQGIDALLASGENAAKSNGQDTIASILLAGAKDFLGKKQSEREALIDEAAELQREGIRSEYAIRKDAVNEEKDARIRAINEESKARIETIEAEVKAQARLAGVEKAPITPEEARENLIADAEKDLARNKKLIGLSAASEPVVTKQQEFLQGELKLEAEEEAQQKAIEAQAGEYLSPAIEEDALPGVATPAPSKVESDIAEPVREAAEATKAIEGTAGVGGKAAEAVLATGAAGTAATGAATVGAATTGAAAAGAGAAGAGAAAAGAAGAGVAAGAAGAATGALGAIASGVGAIAPAVAGVALPIALGVKALKDINDALPIATSALGAIGEGSKLLGPIILSAAWEIGGYITEVVTQLVEVIDSIAHPFSDTRKEKLEKSGALDQERDRVAQIEQQKQKVLSDAVNTSMDVRYGTAEGLPQRVESVYTTPVDEQKLLQVENQASDTSDLQQAITAMAGAQEQAARRQAQLGQGAVPLQLSVPALESFNM